jgi:hypothetical protein
MTTLPIKYNQVTEQSLKLDQATNMADLARADVAKLLPQLPDSAPLWCSVDLLQAIRHLRRASVLIDRAADALEHPEVAR